MKKYRIVKHTHFCRYISDPHDSGTEYCKFEVQKRFLGFLWWYNFNNIDAYVDGIYDTIEEAREAICRDVRTSRKEVIEEYE